MLLHGDFLEYVSPTAPTQLQIATINRIIDRLNQMLSQIVLSDGTSKRMLFGFQKDGWGTGKDFGIKISAPGVDVTTANDTQLIFKMDMDTWQWFDPSSRNYVNIGKRSTGTYGFEMAKPGETLNAP